MEESYKFDDAWMRLKQVLGAKTQNEIARKLGVSQAWVSKNFINKNIPPEWLLKVQTVCQINPQWLLFGKRYRKYLVATNRLCEHPCENDAGSDREMTTSGKMEGHSRKDNLV